jgi:CHAD domain-containing protein
VAKAREIRGLNAEQPYAAVAARVVEVRAAEVAAHSAGVLEISDIERLHDMRVATRRLRAALEVFEPCFPRKRFKRVLREVKALADALGARRDPDVTIAELERFAAAVGGAERPGVELMIERMREHQREANAELAPYVAAERLTGLAERLGELIAAARAAAPEPVGAPAGAGPTGNGAGAS